MTESFAKRLRLPQRKCHVPIGVLDDLSTVASHSIDATIQARANNYQRTLTFLTVPNISALIPDQPIDRSSLAIPRNLNLADPDFHRPAPVDLLLGSGMALSLLCVGQIDLSPPNGPDLVLQKTRFGWVIGGSVPAALSDKKQFCHSTSGLQLDLTRFWEIEEGPPDPTPVEIRNRL